MKKYLLGMWLGCFLIMMAAASHASAETLTITMTGTGRGIVSAETGTIVWSGLTGTADYDLSTAVTLTALPNAGVTFMGWSGACTGTGPCALAMDTAMSVTALFSAVPQTGQTTVYAAGDNGNLQWGVAWPTQRFTVSSNGTGTVVTDNLTGLIWPQDGGTPTVGLCSGGTMTWQGALDYVACLNTNNYLGHDDRRLPNMNELKSLANNGQSSPATWLNTQGLTNVQAGYYWSSSTYADDTSHAWIVVMRDGYVSSGNKTVNIFCVWPVRGGQSGSFGNSTILTVSKNGMGRGSVATDTGTLLWTGATGTAMYSLNTSVTITATPDTGYHIKSVTGCGGTWDGIITGGTYTTGSVTNNCTVRAAFVINKYTVTPTAWPNGVISPSAPQTLKYNTTKKFAIKPNKGYQIDSVNGCNGTLSGSYYTTGPIAGDCTINATFKQ